jgi:hypothetical protein
MPTKGDINHMARNRGYDLNKDYILVGDTALIPNGDGGPAVRAQVWIKNGDSFEFSHYANAISESALSNPEDSENYLSTACFGCANKKVGVLRLSLI